MYHVNENRYSGINNKKEIQSKRVFAKDDADYVSL